MPEFEDRIELEQFDLIGEARPIKQGIVSLIGRAAKPVFNDDHAKAAIDGIQNRREHANIRLGSRDDQSADVLFREEELKGACEKGGIARLVDNCRRRDKARKRRNYIKSSRRQSWLRRAIPAREVPLPATGSVGGRNGRDEAGKYGARRIIRDKTSDAGRLRHSPQKHCGLTIRSATGSFRCGTLPRAAKFPRRNLFPFVSSKMRFPKIIEGGEIPIST